MIGVTTLTQKTEATLAALMMLPTYFACSGIRCIVSRGSQRWQFKNRSQSDSALITCRSWCNDDLCVQALRVRALRGDDLCGRTLRVRTLRPGQLLECARPTVRPAEQFLTS
eukprot:TRINITY_DN83741_c0_g1_i1.p2 TRINITY_DN83741_c0_g1~~TRINITY_DN83741_c0_g1_i1.p2  ORF type:complete len:112 (-),score=15.21 TRINITY_DN83741_c0_g1_i1:16-351(-)